MGTQITEPLLGTPLIRVDTLSIDNKTTVLNKGLAEISISNWNNASQPTITAGSVYEINGSFFSETTNAAVSSWSASGTRYLYATASGSSTSWSSSASAPSWDAALQGYYNGTSARAFYIVINGDKYRLHSQNNQYFPGDIRVVGQAIIGGGASVTGGIGASGTITGGNVTATSLLSGDNLSITNDIDCDTINTGHGDNNVYPMGQGVRPADDVEFNNIDVNADLTVGNNIFCDDLYLSAGASTLRLLGNVTASQTFYWLDFTTANTYNDVHDAIAGDITAATETGAIGVYNGQFINGVAHGTNTIVFYRGTTPILTCTNGLGTSLSGDLVVGFITT